MSSSLPLLDPVPPGVARPDGLGAAGPVQGHKRASGGGDVPVDAPATGHVPGDVPARAGGDVPVDAPAHAVASLPPAGAATEVPGALLGLLRSPLTVRPAVDRGLAGGLRAWLEDGVATAAGPVAVEVRPGPAGSPLLTPVLSPAHRLPTAGTRPGEGRAPGAGNGGLSSRDLRTALLRTVFRLCVTAGTMRAPFEDALAALAVDDEGGDVVQAVQRLGRHRRAQLREVVRHAAATIASQWGPVPAAWLPRTAERLVAPLGGGCVVLRSDADLVMGCPSSGRASVCAVRVHGGGIADDRPNRRLLALLETLRSGAAPFRVASYDLDRGRLAVDDVTDEQLALAVRDVLALTRHDADATWAP